MAKVYKPVKPKKTDSIEKHLKYAADLQVWNDALANKDKTEQVKELIRKGDIDAAMKIHGSKGGSKGKPKRQSISI
jgi:hypothetical protein